MYTNKNSFTHFWKICFLSFLFLFPALLSGCSFQDGKNAIQTSKRQDIATVHTFQEQLYAKLDDTNGRYCSLFLDEDIPYCLQCYTKESEEQTQTIYQIIKPPTDKNTIQTKFTSALQLCQEKEPALQNPDISFKAQCPGDGYLYLIGKTTDHIVEKIYRLFPEEGDYEEIPIPAILKRTKVLDIAIYRDGTIYVVTKGDLYTYQEKRKGFEWESYTYFYEGECHFVPSNYYYYYLSKGKVYRTYRYSNYQYLSYIQNDRLTDVNAPACVDEDDRIYIADSCGIMSYLPQGTLWELLVSSTSCEGFSGEDRTPLGLCRTQNGNFYMAVEDKKNRQVLIYAYTDDRR